MKIENQEFKKGKVANENMKQDAKLLVRKKQVEKSGENLSPHKNCITNNFPKIRRLYLLMYKIFIKLF